CREWPGGRRPRRYGWPGRHPRRWHRKHTTFRQANPSPKCESGHPFAVVASAFEQLRAGDLKVLDCIDLPLSPVSASVCTVSLTTLLPTIKGKPLHEKAVATLAAPIRPALISEPAYRPTVFGPASA